MSAKLSHFLLDQRLQHGNILLTEERAQGFSSPTVQLMRYCPAYRLANIESPRLFPVFIAHMVIIGWIDSVQKRDVIDVKLVGCDADDRS